MAVQVGSKRASRGGEAIQGTAGDGLENKGGGKGLGTRVFLVAMVLLSCNARAEAPKRCRNLFSGTLEAGSFARAASAVDASDEIRIEDLISSDGKVTKALSENFKLQLVSFFQVIENHYAPLIYKIKKFKFDWAKVRSGLLKSSSRLESSNSQYFEMANLLYTNFKDAHVSVSIPSSLRWKLPLQLAVAHAKFFVNYVDGSYPDDVRRPGIGDELVLINDEAPDEFRKRFPVWNSTGNPDTDRGLFAMKFYSWSEESGLPLSELDWKSIRLRFRAMSSGEEYQVTLPFKHEGVGLIGKDLDQIGPNPPVVIADGTGQNGDEQAEALRQSLFSRKSMEILERFHALFRAEIPRGRLDIAEMADGINPPPEPSGSNQVPETDSASPLETKQEQKKSTGQMVGLGRRLPFFSLPPNFRPITYPAQISQNPAFASLLNADHFFAGTFEVGGVRIGFLRVPTYAPKLEMILPSLRYFIGRLQKESDLLIMDQTSNPGGAVVYSDLLIKALVGQYDLSKHMRFAVRPSQNFLRQFMELKTSIEQNVEGLLSPAEAAELTKHMNEEYTKIYRAWADRDNLSEPVSLNFMSRYFERAMEKILAGIMQSPNTPLRSLLDPDSLGVDVTRHQVYTKPVYLLVNELDFSGGDATPANLEDYGRVRIVSVGNSRTTAGAGATVERFPIRGAIEMDLNLSTSLMVRPRGQLVENLGVKSHLHVPVTQQDIAENYRSIFIRVLKTIGADLQASSRKGPPPPR